MFGFRYLKAAPTSFIIQYKAGRIRREGAGLSLMYFAPTSTIVAVPLSSADVPFVFQESTLDFQAVTVQGQLTYRISEPKKIAALLDYSLSPSGVHRSEDPEKLQERLIHTTQALMRAVVLKLNLRQTLVSGDSIAGDVVARLKSSDDVTRLGVEILGLSILAVKPTPEMSKALEAEAREALQRNADEAIYARRKGAVEQERTIKESELNTELAMEIKRREIRETQMAAEIAVETQRAKLIEQSAANEKTEADAKAYALEANLKPLRDMDWRTLLSVATGGADPRLNIAVAFRELAQNAGKIGELNVSPELLASLIGSKK
jgi:regulator of protease activity HflC (stomatin/prohibitin superfamily)